MGNKLHTRSIRAMAREMLKTSKKPDSLEERQRISGMTGVSVSDVGSLARKAGLIAPRVRRAKKAA